MHTSVRIYQTTNADEVIRRVNQGFIPIINKSSGLISYSAVNAGNGKVFSVSVFQTREQAEASVRLAAEWVKENLASLLTAPEVINGEVVAQSGLTAKR